MAEETEAETEVETEETPAAPSEALDPPKEEAKSPPEGISEDEWDNDVDFSPKQQARFNRLYRQVKEGDTITKQLASDNVVLLDKIDELNRNVTLSRGEDRMATLRQQIVQASEEGDTAKVLDLTDEIADIKGESNAAPEKPAKSTIPESKPEPTEAENEAVMAWAFERDTQGNYLRPWSHPGHPDYEKTTALFDKAQEGGGTIDYVLLYVGSQMTPRSRAAVLDPQRNHRPRTEKTTLTAEEKTVAHRMYAAAGISPKDAEARYAKSKKELGIGRTQ